MRRTHLVLLVLVGASLALAAQAAQADDSVCLECHGNPDLAEDGVRIVDAAAYQQGVHAALSCDTCHEGQGQGAFEVVPHQLEADGPPACMGCHDDDFEGIREEAGASVHRQRLGETFTCARCHNPHDMKKDRDELARKDRVPMANHACVKCHRDSVFRVVGRHDGKKPSTVHDWLPNLEKHARMRCVVCHTPVDGKDLHNILPKEEAVRDCASCHDVNSPMIKAYIGKDERLGWVSNPILFEDAYVPGATRNRLADAIIVALLGFAVLGALGHGLLRILTKRNEGAHTVEKLYLYKGSTRLWHWTNAVLFVLLALTGIRIHFGGCDAPLCSFELAFNVHNLAGAAMVVAGLFFVVSNFASGNWRFYLQAPKEGLTGVFKQARWYLIWIFKGEPHPFHPSEDRKFNPLQQLTYSLLMYGFFPLLLLTGVVLLYPSILPEKIGGRPGPWWVATVHFLVGMGTILFLIGHLYLGTMGDRLTYLVQGMITGWHKHHVPTRDASAPGDSPRS